MLRRRIVLFVALSLIALCQPAHAGQETGLVRLPFLAETGQTARYRFEHRASYDDHQEPVIDARSEVTIEVLGPVPEGFRMAMTLDLADGSIRPLSERGVDANWISRFSGTSEGLTVIYIADRHGSPVRVENLEEFRARQAARLADFRQEVVDATSGMPGREAMIEAVDMVGKVFGGMTQETAMTILLGNVGPAFLLCGTELPVDGFVDIGGADELSPGAPPMETVEERWLSSLDDAHAVIEMRRRNDPETTKAAFEAALADKLLKVEKTVSVRARLRRSDGWPEGVHSESRFVLNEMTEVHFRTATRLD